MHILKAPLFWETTSLSYFREISFHIEFLKIQHLANDGILWIASQYFSDSFECSLYVISIRQEEASGSWLISTALASRSTRAKSTYHAGSSVDAAIQWISVTNSYWAIQWLVLFTVWVARTTVVFSGIVYCVWSLFERRLAPSTGKKKKEKKHFPVDKCRLNQFSSLPISGVKCASKIKLLGLFQVLQIPL